MNSRMQVTTQRTEVDRQTVPGAGTVPSPCCAGELGLTEPELTQTLAAEAGRAPHGGAEGGAWGGHHMTSSPLSAPGHRGW